MLVIGDNVMNNLIWIACNNTMEEEQCWGDGWDSIITNSWKFH